LRALGAVRAGRADSAAFAMPAMLIGLRVDFFAGPAFVRLLITHLRNVRMTAHAAMTTALAAVIDSTR